MGKKIEERKNVGKENCSDKKTDKDKARNPNRKKHQEK